MDRQGFKLLLISLAMLVVIPLSIRTSDLIYETYRQSIDTTISSAEQLSAETTELSNAENEGVLQSILRSLSETKDSITEKASNVMNRFVESLAVMIVTSCVIPILVLLFFLWIVKQLTGIDLRDLGPHRPPHVRGFRKSEEDAEAQQRSSI